MDRRRKPNKVTLNTINISMETAATISKLKNRRETQDDFIRRILTDGKDFQEYKLDIDPILKLKDRKISNLEIELKNHNKNSILSI
jgi:hypothetical protein